MARLYIYNINIYSYRDAIAINKPVSTAGLPMSSRPHSSPAIKTDSVDERSVVGGAGVIVAAFLALCAVPRFNAAFLTVTSHFRH